MTITKRRSPTQKKKSSLWLLFDLWFKNIWVAKLIAIIALANLLLVVFDFSYLHLRDFWLQGKVTVGNIKIGPIESKGMTWQILPKIVSETVTKYDIIKGIETYRETDEYLLKVDELETKIGDLNSPEGEKILADLRNRSEEMITNNPFQLANKTGNLEKIKNRMRRHLPNAQNSGKEAFREFWTQEHLRRNAVEELNFFNQKIRPLIAANYFRPLGENGNFVDNFGLIDFPFFVIFLVDFLGRTLYISRHHIGVNWLDAMLWRWYDIFLLIPLFRWLRVLPVIIRLNEANLIDLRQIKRQTSQGFVASIAQDLTEVILLQIISKIQGAIRQGEIVKIISKGNVYIDINDTNETAEIVKIMAKMTISQVLPKVRTEVEDLLEYNIAKIVKKSAPYQGMQKLPGVEKATTNLSEQLAKQIYQGIHEALSSMIEEDPKFDQLLEKLIDNFGKTMTSEIKTQESLERIESLLVDFLEEIKINYVQSLAEEDVEELLEQTRILRQITDVPGK
ncbi:MAG: hypothetical protein DSM107014_05175 [Gomphosphaeria aponina SAG 52.96 = DSM 107014]|uniref:Uncharacterized protein n=1 Tax=Gomphosphaeria aponina SAG 52.96 = DSM 107014 TaxID=1521640 RepID=A0A941GP53_9CHRO|nr:hypothetical protein [Gomphosphaeria aponina SAG 52.96 = DSM 107014]